MKSVFQKISALLTVFAMMFAFTLTSCDIGPEPAPQTLHTDSIELDYSLVLDQTWWDFFDIEVTYTTAASFQLFIVRENENQLENQT